MYFAESVHNFDRYEEAYTAYLNTFDKCALTRCSFDRVENIGENDKDVLEYAYRVILEDWKWANLEAYNDESCTAEEYVHMKQILLYVEITFIRHMRAVFNVDITVPDEPSEPIQEAPVLLKVYTDTWELCANLKRPFERVAFKGDVDTKFLNDLIAFTKAKFKEKKGEFVAGEMTLDDFTAAKHANWCVEETARRHLSWLKWKEGAI